MGIRTYFMVEVRRNIMFLLLAAVIVLANVFWMCQMHRKAVLYKQYVLDGILPYSESVSVPPKKEAPREEDVDLLKYSPRT